MSNRLSNSAVSTYSACPRKYKLRYKDKLRPKLQHGALLFGSAIDAGINELLKTKSLPDAINAFDKAYQSADINGFKTQLATSEDIIYAERDFDADLLKPEDQEAYSQFKAEKGLKQANIKEDLADIDDRKSQVSFNGLTSIEKQLYNYANWLCMRRKGHLMLQGYHKTVLPRIKQVFAIQKEFNLSNGSDSILGFIDFIAELDDGKRYILDNKTSYMRYEKDSPSKSQQLILYYHAEKEAFKLDGVGFVVLYKQLLKNKTKLCSVCGKDGTGQRHKTCDNSVDGERCNGAWIETISPECNIEILTSGISQAAEDLVIETFDEANQGIKKQAFGPNLNSCRTPFPCPYEGLCWRGDKSELVRVD